MNKRMGVFILAAWLLIWLVGLTGSGALMVITLIALVLLAPEESNGHRPHH